jgi:hypothetical protein
VAARIRLATFQERGANRSAPAGPATSNLPPGTDEQHTLVGDGHIRQVGQLPHLVVVVKFVSEPQLLHLRPALPQHRLSIAQLRKTGGRDSRIASVAELSTRTRRDKLPWVDKQRLHDFPQQLP